VGEHEAQRVKTVEQPKGPQKKAALTGERDDQEREAEQVASRVGGGGQIEPGAISAATDRDHERQRAPAKPGGEATTKAVQKAPAAATKTADPKASGAGVQKAPAATGEASATMLDRRASEAIARRRTGEPLNAATKSVLESRMGIDLGDVRVHQDESERRDAAAIEARAFTYGKDIWLGPGESQSDIELMAHEATHVVQQAGGVQGGVVQRATDTAAGDWDYVDPEGRGKIKKDERLSIPVLKVPDFKVPFIKGPLPLLKRTKAEEEEAEKGEVDEGGADEGEAGTGAAAMGGAGTGKRKTNQLKVWEDHAAKGKLETQIDDKIGEGNAPSMQKGAQPVYFMELPGEKFFVIGTKAQIKKRLLRPFWDQAGKKHAFHVDHKLEFQLTPEGGKHPDDIENLWLLDAKANMSSGSNIKREKEGKIVDLLNAASETTKEKKGKGKTTATKVEKAPSEEDKSKPIFKDPPAVEQVRKDYSITFEKVEGGLNPKGTPDTWKLEHIKDEALQLAKLDVLTVDEITARGLQGSPSCLVIYTNEAGGGMRTIKWSEDATSTDTDVSYGERAFHVHKVEYDKNKRTGTIHGTAYEGSKLLDKATLDLPIKRMAAVEHGGYTTYRDVEKAFKLKGLSPIEMYTLELTDRGWEGRGLVLPTVPLIKDIGIEVVLDGDDIYLSKTFTADDFSFPGPIQVTSASLEIFAGTNGLGAKGDVLFQIERVGKGKLSAGASLSEGFSIAGDFDFDSELFDPATVHVEYSHDTFSGHGVLGIPEGKVSGIKSASLKVAFQGEKIDATGTVKPSIPGIEQGDMAFHYAPDTGIVISGTLALKKDIPGLAGGSVSAELAKRPGDDQWRVKASGEATPAIPGVSAKLMVTYDDGTFDAVGTAGYDKGMLKGSITIGATNRPVGEDGVPGDKPAAKADKVTIYGGGSLTLRIAPWLQATATVRLLPNAEIEVAGQIGLPSSLDIFPEKRLDKNIFKIGLDIPIVGVAIAGQRIGIFANITGGLDLSAGIGPGQLQDLHLGVTYNPSHEEKTHVEGGAKLHIPARAGLRLFVRGGLGLGIPIVSAQAGLEIGGQLGLEGAVDASVAVDWLPSRGLQIDALGEIYVQPKFVFDVTGFVLVEADLLLTTIELYSKKWELAKMEYGSGLKFGIKFPIRYREGQPFDISLSDVTFDVPPVEPAALLKGLVEKIA
jgi:hypothetical protein